MLGFIEVGGYGIDLKFVEIYYVNFWYFLKV